MACGRAIADDLAGRSRTPWYWRPYQHWMFNKRWQTDAMVGATQNAVVNDYDGGRDTSSTASGYDPYGLKTQLLTGASGPSVHQL